jgi:dihydroorotase
MRIRILGARVIDPSCGFDQLADIYIESGKIIAIGQAPAGFIAEQSIDAEGLS